MMVIVKGTIAFDAIVPSFMQVLVLLKVLPEVL